MGVADIEINMLNNPEIFSNFLEKNKDKRIDFHICSNSLVCYSDIDLTNTNIYFRDGVIDYDKVLLFKSFKSKNRNLNDYIRKCRANFYRKVSKIDKSFIPYIGKSFLLDIMMVNSKSSDSLIRLMNLVIDYIKDRTIKYCNLKYVMKLDYNKSIATYIPYEYEDIIDKYYQLNIKSLNTELNTKINELKLIKIILDTIIKDFANAWQPRGNNQ